MILQALAKYYENLAEEGKVPKPGWCSAKVSYQINLSEEGDVKGISCLKTEEERGKKTVQVPQVFLVPEMVTRSSGVSANFLCDNAKYLLGISQEQMKKAKREQKSALMLQGKDIYLYWLREKVRWPRQYTYFLKSGILKKQWNIRKSEIIGKKLQMEAI